MDGNWTAWRKEEKLEKQLHGIEAADAILLPEPKVAEALASRKLPQVQQKVAGARNKLGKAKSRGAFHHSLVEDSDSDPNYDPHEATGGTHQALQASDSSDDEPLEYAMLAAASRLPAEEAASLLSKCQRSERRRSEAEQKLRERRRRSSSTTDLCPGAEATSRWDLSGDGRWKMEGPSARQPPAAEPSNAAKLWLANPRTPPPKGGEAVENEDSIANDDTCSGDTAPSIAKAISDPRVDASHRRKHLQLFDLYGDECTSPPATPDKGASRKAPDMYVMASPPATPSKGAEQSTDVDREPRKSGPVLFDLYGDGSEKSAATLSQLPEATAPEDTDGSPRASSTSTKSGQGQQSSVISGRAFQFLLALVAVAAAWTLSSSAQARSLSSTIHTTATAEQATMHTTATAAAAQAAIDAELDEEQRLLLRAAARRAIDAEIDEEQRVLQRSAARRAEKERQERQHQAREEAVPEAEAEAAKLLEAAERLSRIVIDTAVPDAEVEAPKLTEAPATGDAWGVEAAAAVPLGSEYWEALQKRVKEMEKKGYQVLLRPQASDVMVESDEGAPSEAGGPASALQELLGSVAGLPEQRARNLASQLARQGITAAQLQASAPEELAAVLSSPELGLSAGERLQALKGFRGGAKR